MDKDKTIPPLSKTTVMQSVILPTHLRIGNLVECFGTREVIAIRKHKIKVQHESKHGNFIIEWCPITSLEPIIISKEWLIKLKFEIKKYDSFSLIEKGFQIDFELIQGSVYHSFLDGTAINIHYLHELQNLFFFLTGRELTVA